MIVVVIALSFNIYDHLWFEDSNSHVTKNTRCVLYNSAQNGAKNCSAWKCPPVYPSWSRMHPLNVVSRWSFMSNCDVKPQWCGPDCPLQEHQSLEGPASPRDEEAGSLFISFLLWDDDDDEFYESRLGLSLSFPQRYLLIKLPPYPACNVKKRGWLLQLLKFTLFTVSDVSVCLTPSAPSSLTHDVTSPCLGLFFHFFFF